MRGHHLRALALALTALPFNGFALPVTYDFQATGWYADVYGSLPKVPPEWADATEWDVRGTIIVDSDIGPVFADPYIVLGQTIIGGSLSINGISLGAFDPDRPSTFEYFFMDGFEESEHPYDINMALFLDENESVGPAYFSYYTEDLSYSGPNLENVNLTDLTSFLDAVQPDDYSEMQVTVGSDGNYWELYLDLATGFVARDESVAAPEPASIMLIGLGMMGIWWRWRRVAVPVAALTQP